MPREADKDDLAYVWDTLRYARETERFVRGRTFEEFERNAEFRLAVERTVEIVGEAARWITQEFQALDPHIPWRLIQLQRHVLAHDYGEIIPAKIWDVAVARIPGLIAQLEPLLPPEDRSTPPA